MKSKIIFIIIVILLAWLFLKYNSPYLYFSYDKNKVFYKWEEIEWADASTFKVLSNDWYDIYAEDKSNIYHYYTEQFEKTTNIEEHFFEKTKKQ